MEFNEIMPYMLIFMYILVVLLISLMVSEIYYLDIAGEKACNDLGMELDLFNEQHICIEPNGKGHFVKIKCEGLFWNVKCKATIFSIGDYRVEVN